MTNQLNLFDPYSNEVTEPAPARRTDPETSHKAAAGVDLGRLQSLALDMLRISDEPLTANEVGRRCSNAHGGMAESYRKRCKELVDKGKAVECDERECSVTRKQATTYTTSGGAT